ncbi:hypothetical protein Xcel_0341 [Xylanimonas cellulosilytica DSM 15894]|uniref:Lipoprotein n=1 Tax=Xylanimonas cellulosilytica (strain DSM 15894 / JCM 12276 / CECT 5975 / KCTC 9989 / LMG 20990 / NBRC 107835 / XIL07) TaxID=446471 RepID=D1BVA9_XYLCX|nr:hypothetical protein [Xylanimonas cellulosilytica]ACZ29380.1 hypothetical protein Xcel_0341 [Xylanimonas cellulosilytica DSM 15894]
MLPVRQIPSRRRASVRLAAAFALCAGLLGGCVGPFAPASSEPSIEPLPEASAVIVAPDAVIPESDGGSVPAPSDEPDDEAAPDDEATPEDEAAVEETSDCVDLQTAWTTTNQALVSLSPEHPRAFVNSFRVAADAMAGVTVPDDVADDWAAMSAYLARVNAAFADVDANDADAVASAMRDAVSAQDTEAAAATAREITSFLAADCPAE